MGIVNRRVKLLISSLPILPWYEKVKYGFNYWTPRLTIVFKNKFSQTETNIVHY